jgi:hypothetical protein
VLCHDDDILNAFKDGVLWLTLGESPGAAALIGKLRDLIETLSGDRTLQCWDLTNGSRTGLYVADAAITTALVGMEESRIFAGDALGNVHCISLRPVNSN